MTLQELRVEADKLGYSVVKKRVWTKFAPCVCGHNQRTHLHKYIKDTGEFIDIIECKNCGRKVTGFNEKDAKLNWNKEMTKQK